MVIQRARRSVRRRATLKIRNATLDATLLLEIARVCNQARLPARRCSLRKNSLQLCGISSPIFRRRYLPPLKR